MSQARIAQEAKKLAEQIGKELHPKKIIFFGSASYGKAKSNSDIDLCVVIDGERLNVKQKIWDLLWKNNYSWMIEPDIHVYSPDTYSDYLLRDDPFLREVNKGKLLYEG